MVDTLPADDRTRLTVARAIGITGVVLSLLGLLAHDGWGPIRQTWSEVAGGVGMFLVAPYCFIASKDLSESPQARRLDVRSQIIASNLAGYNRKLQWSSGAAFAAIGCLRLVTGVLAVLR